MLIEDNNLEMMLFRSRYLKQKKYWTKKLSVQVETTNILKDNNNYRGDTFETGDISTPVNTGHYEIPFDDKLSKRILNICKHSELSLYIFLLSALNLLIHRYTTQKDIIILSPIYKQKATAETINSLVLIRHDVDGTQPFKELVLNLRMSVLEAYENQDYPYEKLEEYLFPSSSPSHISCCLENIHRKADIEKIKARLSFCFSTGGENIRGCVLYDPKFYLESAIHPLADHFLLLLTRAGENINTRIADIDFLTEEEKKQLLKDFNNNKVDFSRNKTLPCRFEEQVEKTPDTVAIACNRNQATYIELNRMANRLANLLRIYNLQQDQTVGILFQRSLQMAEGILAVWKAGGAYIPLDTDDPVQRLQGILADSAAALLLSQTQWVPPQLEKTYNGNILLPDEQQKEAQQDSENRADSNLNIAPGSLAYVIYTSGSTGKPKGAMVEHIGMMNHIYAKINALQLTATSIVAQNASHTFDISVWQFFAVFAAGGKTIIYPNPTIVEPNRFISRATADQLTVLEVVPSYLSVMLEFLNIDFRHFDSLKYLLVTGETIKPGLVNQWFDKYPTVKMVNAYGPTEASDDITHFIMDKPLGMERVPIGKPVQNLNIYILDEYMNLCPPGIKGEICVSGVGVGRGYLNNPGLTADKFINPGSQISKKAGIYRSYRSYKSYILYKTGDLGRWLPDGSIEFFGRKDYQVKVRGFRIELEEIEKQILNHGSIKEAVVIDKVDKQGSKYLCAYMIGGEKTNIPGLKGYLEKQLPAYMVPAFFVDLPEIPLTPNGKIDRKALPDPTEISLPEASQYIPPVSDLEKKLVEIWEKVLGKKNIGINENFFMSGGDSIKAIQIMARMSSAGYKLDMRDLFQYPSISQLAPYIKKSERIPGQTAISGTIPLTPIQVEFFNNSYSAPHHYNQAVLLFSKEGFDKEAIKEVFTRIQEHHDALRVTYEKNGDSGQVVQVAHGLDFPLSLQEYDLRNRENRIEELTGKVNEIQASIDLEKGPLMKLGLFRLDDGDRLLIVVHHLVIDGVSWRILFEDIDALYGQYKRGEKPILPKKTDSFKLWSEKLSAYANSKTFLKEKTYWQKIESVEAPPIPKDFNVDDNYIKDIGSVSFTLREEDTERLLTKVNEPFRTEINDILLAALGMGIKKTFELDRVLVVLEGHGREEILEDMDIDRTVGWYTSVSPVLIDISYAGDLGRQIKEIKETLRRIPNKGIGYGILKYLTGEENKKEIQFKLKPQISFNYMGQFDEDVKQMSYFEIAEESVGNSASIENQREFELDVVGMMVNNRLTMTISFNKTHFKPGTISALVDNLETELKKIIEFCCSREKIERTPADFIYKGLSIESVDRLMESYPNVEDLYTLTPMQEGMLFHALADDSSHSYFVQPSYRLQGKLDIRYIEISLNELSKRHDILRTAFVYKDIECPVQLVLKDRVIGFYYEDISNLEGSEEKENFIKGFKKSDKDRSFDLSKGTLMRVSIHRLEDLEYEFTWSFHHILMDGWCIGILNNEFFEIYHSYLENRPYRLQVVKPYRTYIQWLEKQDKNASAEYWQNYLDSFEEQTGVPRTRRLTKEENQNGYRNETVSVVLDMEKTAGLNKLAGRNHATLNTVTQAVWGILLGKYNGKEDVVFGAVVSGRPSGLEGVESMVGLFINTIPVRIRFEEKMKFYRLLHKVQEEALSCEPYHYHPLAEIQSGAVLKQNLIDHLFIFENYPIAEQIEGYGIGKNKSNKTSLKLANVEVFEQTNYDFNVILGGSARLWITFLYNGNVYEEGFVERIAKHFTLTFDQVIKNQELEVGELMFLSAEEKNRILYEFNDTALEYPKDKTIHRLFEEQVEHTPDHVALVGPKLQNTKYKLQTNSKFQITNKKIQSPMAQQDTERGYITITYNELNMKSGRLAHMFIEKGVQPETIVGINVERSVEMVIGILGILKAGPSYLPIDPEYPEDRIDFMLKDSGAKLLVTTSNKEGEKVRRWEGEKICLDSDYYPGRGEVSSPASHQNFVLVSTFAPPTSTLTSTSTCQVCPANLAYVIYTSGSTGRPKGVMVEHWSVVNILSSLQSEYPFSSADVYLLKTSYIFDVSVTELFGWFFGKGRLIILEQRGEKDPQRILETIAREYVTHINFVPSMFNAFLEYMTNENQGRLVSLKYIFLAGEELLPELVERFRRLGTKITLENIYGPTEGTIYSSRYSLTDWHNEASIPIGKPFHNIGLFIFNKSNHLQAVGIPGELYIAGPGLARGYLNRPELTAEKFDQDLLDYQDYHDEKNQKFLRGSSGGAVFSKSAPTGRRRQKIYKTGDLARLLSDGNIEFLGRVDNQVKIRGQRIELGEIENELSKHNDINEAVVVAGENEKGSNYLCAYLVCRNKLELSELREYLRKQLPDYMIPSYFVNLGKIPLTASGKIDRKALPDPGGNILKDNLECRLPQNEVEKILIEIWQKVLGRNNIGIDENFFMIGGDSIKSIQIISRMSRAGYKMEMKDLFQYPVISDLAPRVKKLKRIPDQSVITGTIPLTPIQKAFFNESHSDPHHYNQAVMLYSNTELDKKIVKKVFTKIQEHHDALRMTYQICPENGEAVQIDHGLDYPLSIAVYDLRNKESGLEEFGTKLNEIQASIDLEKGPLMKLGLFHLDDGNRLLIAIHHLVIDGVSWRVLFEDIETLYSQYKQSKKLVLPPKTDSFKLWAEKISEYANSKTFLKEKGYWAQLESKIIPGIPKDFEIEENNAKDTRSLSFSLGEEETDLLLTGVNHAFRTEINDILLTAFGMGIKKTFGQDRVLVALEGHGRENILEGLDISRTVGWFTGVYPLVLDISYSDHTGRQIKEVKESLRRIPNKGIGYGILKYITREENKKEIEFKLKPQISFNYLGQFDADVKQLSSFEPAKESAGDSWSLNNKREYLLDVIGITANNRLTMTISFNKRHFKAETIATFSEHFESELRHLIAFCSSKDKTEFTPSDFTYKGLSMGKVEELAGKYSIQDIYILTPMQEGKLFYTLYNQAYQGGIVQINTHIAGDLDLSLFERSINVVIKRYDILRAIFLYEGIQLPIQIILKERRLDILYNDLREVITKGNRQPVIDEFAEKDRKIPLDLTKDVLLRISVLQTGEREYEVTWSFHHILMDGWCLGILFSDFLEIYNSLREDRPAQLQEVQPFKRYIRWLMNQDNEEPGNYWKKYLEGFNRKTGIPKKKETKDDERGYRFEKILSRLKEDKTSNLYALAERNQVTLNTIIHAVWGIILGKYNREEDVVFGAVVSGRPSEIPGVESMVGLFINTIPVRMACPGEITFKELLDRIRKKAIESEPYHHYPLTRIHAETSLKQDLLDHILVFENYPLAKQVEGLAGRTGKRAFEVTSVTEYTQPDYNFHMVIQPGNSLGIEFRFNALVYDDNFVAKIGMHIEEVVNTIIDNSDVKLEDITFPGDWLTAKSPDRHHYTEAFGF